MNSKYLQLWILLTVCVIQREGSDGGPDTLLLIRNGKSVDCVEKDAPSYEEYNMQIPSPSDDEGRVIDMQCLVEKKLVYACHKGKCEEHGMLKNNVVPWEIIGRPGIHLSNLPDKMLTTYTCCTYDRCFSRHLRFCTDDSTSNDVTATTTISTPATTPVPHESIKNGDTEENLHQWMPVVVVVVVFVIIIIIVAVVMLVKCRRQEQYRTAPTEDLVAHENPGGPSKV